MKLKTINIVTIPKGITGEKILGLYSNFSGKRVVVVNIRLPSILLMEQLEKQDIDISKFLFIDCLGKGKDKSEQIINVQSPAALTGISMSVKNALLLIKPDIIIFDTVSNFLSYTNDLSVLKFMQDISSVVRNMKFKLIILIEQKDLDDKLSSLSMLSDTVVKI